MDRKELKTLAKKRLSENRWPMVLVALVVCLLTGVSSAMSGVKFDVSYEMGDVSNAYSYQQSNPVLSLISLLLSIFVVSILSIGACKFYRHNIRENQDAAMMFDGFKKNYGKNVLTSFLVTIFVFIGCILLIVPGIIVGLGLTLVPYILAENPDMGAMDIIKMSWNKMKGHKWEYFVLVLSFIGWFLLDVLTLGIAGIFYIHPYAYQTFANYCDKVLAE